VAETIPDGLERGQALAGIARRLAGAAAADPALIERLLRAAAEAFPLGDQERSDAVARIHSLTRSGMLDELSRWRLRPLGASVALLGVFLENCHDRTITEMIGLAVLDTAPASLMSVPE